jgi:hypothetical protein
MNRKFKEINISFIKETVHVTNINIPAEYCSEDKILVGDITGTDKCNIINVLMDSGLIVTESRQNETLQIKPAKNYNLCIKDNYPGWKTLVITKQITKIQIDNHENI